MTSPDSQPPTSFFDRFRALGPAGILGILALALPPLGSIFLFAYMKTIGEWLRSHQEWGPWIFTGSFALLAGIALLPTYAQSALGGWAFGFKLGFPAALLGFAGGSIIGYFIARTTSRERVEKVIQSDVRFAAVRDALIGGAGGKPASFFKQLGMVALLRCPPNSPFALTNLVFAASGVRLLPFVFGTIIGMAPRTAVAVMIGAGINDIISEDNLKQAAPNWLWGVSIGLSIVVMIVVMVIAKRAIERLVRSKNAVPTRGL
jgi:uncharacterized membrane protein YdjX (TVP38/TMEM64 family)